MDYGFYLLNVDGVAKSVQAYKAALVVSLRLENVSVYFHVYTRAVTFTVIIQRRQFNLLLSYGLQFVTVFGLILNRIT